MNNEERERNLLSCPFCGSDQIEIVEFVPESWVTCRSCYAQSDSATRRNTAITKWNTRPALTVEDVDRIAKSDATGYEDSIYEQGWNDALRALKAALATRPGVDVECDHVFVGDHTEEGGVMCVKCGVDIYDTPPAPSDWEDELYRLAEKINLSEAFAADDQIEEVIAFVRALTTNTEGEG